MQKSTNKIKVIVSAVAFILISVIAVLTISEVLHIKDKTYRMNGFMDADKNTYDVVVLGTSRGYSSVMPYQMWQSNGQTVGNLAQSAQPCSASYYLAKYAIRTQSPKLIIFDISALRYKSQVTTSGGDYSYLHESLDNMGFIRERYEAIADFVPFKDWGQFVFPLTLFHSRWDELKQYDFKDPVSYNNGGEGYSGVLPADGTSVTDETMVLENEAEKYYRMLIELCLENNVAFLPIYTPMSNNDPGVIRSQKIANRAAEIAAEYGIKFIDYNKMVYNGEMSFDFAKDFKNKDHVNIYGATKITNHLSEYIKQNYGIPDKRGNEKYATWDKTFSTYEATIKLRYTSNIIEYGKMALNENFITVIFGKGDLRKLAQNGTFNDFFYNTLGLNKNINSAEAGSYICVINAGKIIYEKFSSEESLIFDRYVDDIYVYAASSLTDEDDDEFVEAEVSFADLKPSKCGKNGDGFNIAIYDKTRCAFVDSGYIDANNPTVISHESHVSK